MAGFPLQALGQMPPQGAPAMAPGGPPPPVPAPAPVGAGGIPPQAGAMNGLMMILTFLAGSGLSSMTSDISKLAKLGQPGGADPNRAHRGGVRLDAAQNPGMTIAPQLAQMLAAKAGQQPSGSDELVSALSTALQQKMQGAGPLGSIG